MPTRSDEPILPRHPRWDEFLERLTGPDGMGLTGHDLSDMRWTCFGGEDKRFSRRALQAMGRSERAIEVSLAYFENHGGYCDCEVWMNVGHAWPAIAGGEGG
ncbi:MAG: DUF2695 domain-containing protein [Candidatus Dormiibacterota bacterium]